MNFTSVIKHLTPNIQFLVGRSYVSLFKLLMKSMKNFSSRTVSYNVLLETYLQNVADQFFSFVTRPANNITVQPVVLYSGPGGYS